MKRSAFPVVAVLALAFATGACSRFGPVYPPRPSPSVGAPLADPAPSRVVVHLAITSAALSAALEDAAPRTGEGTFPFLGSDRRYAWERAPLELAFAQGRIVVLAKVRATVSIPLKTIEVPLQVRIEAEPIINQQYAVRLQSVDVHVTSPDIRLSAADRIAGIYEKVQDPIAAKLKEFAYDLKPMIGEAFDRLARPIDLPVGDATACARLSVLEIESGPTVLADGIEKDVALVVAPAVTMPCPETNVERSSLPPLSNVASLTPGPFTVTVPIAARYDELTRAMTMAFTDGKLFFSAEYPSIYLEKPEVYESDGRLVLKLHIAGPVRGLGVETDLDGDLYLVGHPAVVDNELRIPDLEPTIETSNFLLSLKALTSGERIRDEARAALRLDIGQRLDQARQKFGSGLTFGSDSGCFQGDVDRVEVTGVYPHAAYLRIYVGVTAHARATMPCPVHPPDAPTAQGGVAGGT
jgi:hypothetical protein